VSESRSSRLHLFSLLVEVVQVLRCIHVLTTQSCVGALAQLT
jgi:hypothetical protein